MLNIELLDFRRVIMHEIQKKTEREDASCDFSHELEHLDAEVIETLKDRLNNATGRESRCFEMEMAKINNGSFFDLCKNLEDRDDNEFIQVTQSIGNLLAESQKHRRIPGGYIIILEAKYRPTNTATYVIIKAEQHDALTKNHINSRISVLKRIFLSPSQKLYKVGIMHKRREIAEDRTYPNDIFDFYLFDEQLTAKEGLPATYFFDNFLGYSVTKNAKLQTKRFYDKTKEFINQNYQRNYAKQDEILGALKTTIISDLSPIIDPTDFANRYIQEIEVRDRYLAEVQSSFPISFSKDSLLIKTRLEQKKLIFQNKINISGPNSDFEESVSVYDSREALLALQLEEEDDQYTFIVVKGRPQRNA